MKNLKSILIGLLILVTLLLGCSSDDSNENASTSPMTAKINDVFYELVSPFGNDEASGNFLGYSKEEYVNIQGRSFDLSQPAIEINISISRNDLRTGTYNVGIDTDGISTHIDLIDLNTSVG